MSDRLPVLPQYVIPKQALTSFAGWVAGKERGAVTTWIIRRFVAKYGVDMGEALESDISRYASFNEFFTRPQARRTADFIRSTDLSCGWRNQPVRAHRWRPDLPGQGSPLQHYGAGRRRCGTDCAFRARQFRHDLPEPEGLPPHPHAVRRSPSPDDLRAGRPVFGQSDDRTRRARAFARNERVVCVFDTSHGPFVLVLVGATIVGSMATVWQGVINPPRGGGVREWRYDDRDISLKKGKRWADSYLDRPW